MKRRSFLRAGAAGVAAASLPRFSIAQPANARVLKFVPQANLTVLDPIITTAAVTHQPRLDGVGHAVRRERGAAGEAADGRGLHGLR